MTRGRPMPSHSSRARSIRRWRFHSKPFDYALTQQSGVEPPHFKQPAGRSRSITERTQRWSATILTRYFHRIAQSPNEPIVRGITLSKAIPKHKLIWSAAARRRFGRRRGPFAPDRRCKHSVIDPPWACVDVPSPHSQAETQQSGVEPPHSILASGSDSLKTPNEPNDGS